MDSFQVYSDMKARTDGEIYIGVVGPVRTGKSTFIKRFMDLLVLPNMTDEHARERTQDELPQSASGTTIMTTEPKFVPKEAAAVKLSDDVEVKIRLIDCVGYMVEGASGHVENDVERQVKTPWFEYEIPFTKAAAIGTQKVIHDHATIGFVVTTDGSVTDLPRENYIPAEEKENFAGFVELARQVMNLFGYPVSVALAPKTSSDQKGLLYEGMDYGRLGQAANQVMLMTYEWGYALSEPMAVAPIDKVEQVVRFAVSAIPPDKIFLGIPNYGYDW